MTYCKEIEIGEEYHESTRHGHAKYFRKKSDSPVTTMYVEVGKEMDCAFCLEKHPHEDCKRIQDVGEPKNLLVKFGQCFICMRKGHLAKDCSDRKRVICK